MRLHGGNQYIGIFWVGDKSVANGQKKEELILAYCDVQSLFEFSYQTGIGKCEAT